MASTKDYQYMEPSLTQPHCQRSPTGKNGVDLSPMDLDFSSAMTLNNSNNDSVQAKQQHSHFHQHQHHQQQQQQSLPPLPQVSRNSSFRLPSFASLISGRGSHSVPHRDRMGSSSISHPYSNATQSSLHLPRIDHLANRSSMMPIHPSLSVSSSDYAAQQPHFDLLPSSTATSTRQRDVSDFSSVPLNSSNNRAYYTTPSSPAPPTFESILTPSMADTPPTPTPAKNGRRTRKPKFISRILNANIQWSTGNSSSSKNNDGMTFRPYQYEPRRSSQQQQEGRRRRISSVGTASSSLASSAHASSSTTIIGSSPSSPVAPSIISNSFTTKVKPRWQEAERMELLKAIVKEKQLDDMTTFSWDRISLVVGRGTKSCKDQFRREILPALMERLK